MAKLTLRGQEYTVVFSTDAARRFEAITEKRVFDFLDDLAAKRVPAITEKERAEQSGTEAAAETSAALEDGENGTDHRAVAH